MKVSRIILNDFRGFPGPADYEFKLDGRNMLLFGENGSGKSSVFVALREFFNNVTRPPAFQIFRNVFTTDATGQPLTSGKVSMEFDDGSGLHTWDIAGNVRPLSAPAVAEAALRFGAVDYRAMLKTSFIHASGYPNLFDLLVNGVLARMPVTVGGRQTALGKVAEEMRDAKPNGHYAKRLRKVDNACLALNTALANHVPPLAVVASQILSAFGNIGVSFQLIPPPLPVTPPPNPEPPNPPHLRYDLKTRNFANARIDFVAQLYGHGPAEPQHFLNEARLSALALAIFLASIKMSVPPLLPGANTPAKVIILDDVLIGLDMSNRQPLIDVLTREDRPGQPGFSDWQIILMTHDQAWHTLARKQVKKSDWQIVRLATGFNGRHDFPILNDDTSLIDRAELHLNHNGDERAAGVYLRLAFEEMLKGFSASAKLPIAFHLPDEHPRSTNVWWNPICGIKIGNRNLVDAGLKRDVQSCRNNVANPLCHNGSNPPLRSEVVNAILVLRRLQTILNSYPSINQKPPVAPRPVLELAIEACNVATDFAPWTAAVYLRSAFDDALSRLATKKRISVRYDILFLEFEGQRLWQTLSQAPTNLRTLYTAQVAGINSHSAFFLTPLVLATIIVQPQTVFQSALQALLAYPTTPPTAPTTWLDGVP